MDVWKALQNLKYNVDSPHEHLLIVYEIVAGVDDGS